MLSMIITDSTIVRNLEAASAGSGVGLDMLMENAGAKVADLAAKLINEKHIRQVCILCGSGNNGGDGFVAARLLSLLCPVTVILTSGDPATALAKMNFDLMPPEVQVLYYSSHYYECIGIIKDSEMLIDAIYGIGFHGMLNPDIANILSVCSENKNAVKIAVDLPSGIECDTGFIPSDCFQADFTVSFTTLKPLHVLYPSADMCGEISVADVGIPQKILRHSSYTMLSTDTFAAAHPFPKKPSSAHKGTNGTLTALCGSYGMAGAAIMASEAALRCGIGLLRLALPESIYPIVAAKLPEPVYFPLAQSADGIVDIDEYMRIMKLITENTDACLLGCGLGLNGNTRSLVALLIDGGTKPMVLDADGINAISMNINILKRSAAPLILTPHPGELARLLGISVSEVQSDRYRIAKKFAADFGVTLVLKGANTLIATPQGNVYVNLTGNNGMGKGGSGDMLAGMIASFLAQGMTPEEAAVNGVYYHGLVGDRCAEKYSARAMLPSDMISELKTIFL